MRVKKSLSFLLLSLFLACWLTTAGAADPPINATSTVELTDNIAPNSFRVAYRYEIQEQTETTVSGLLIVALENHSDQLLRQASIRVAGLLPTPFGSGSIDFGEIAPGHMKELLIPYVTARDQAEKAAGSTATTWQLEYIDVNSVPVSTDIPGELIL